MVYLPGLFSNGVEHVSIEQPIAGPLGGKCDAAQDGQGAKTSHPQAHLRRNQIMPLTTVQEWATNPVLPLLQPFWHATPPPNISLYPRRDNKRLVPDNHNR